MFLKSKTHAVATVIILKILDVISTFAAITYGNAVHSGEINMLYRILSRRLELLSFETTMYLTIPVAAAIIYFTYDKRPVLTEALILILPVVIISNFFWYFTDNIWIMGAWDIVIVGILILFLTKIKPYGMPLVMRYGEV